MNNNNNSFVSVCFKFAFFLCCYSYVLLFFRYHQKKGKLLMMLGTPRCPRVSVN